MFNGLNRWDFLGSGLFGLIYHDLVPLFLGKKNSISLDFEISFKLEIISA